MTKSIYITRRTISEIMWRGLGYVDVWFHEPCLEVEIFSNKINTPFDDDPEYDKMRKELQGILYTPNTIKNFLYRKDSNPTNHDLEFGDNLVVNGTGEDFPQILIDLYHERKLDFKHRVFGSGNKRNYKPNNVANLFGYDSDISLHIWKLICDDIDTEGKYEQLDWDNISEKERPWWRFCKKIDIELNLKL